MTPEPGPPRPGAYAVVRGDEPKIFLAENADVLSRVLGLMLVAHLPTGEVSSTSRLREIREALLEERWGDALVSWIEETGTAVDVYDEAPRVWSERDLDLDRASMEIRVAPVFSQ